nr:immunoglobulin heavy chain junction region [Mus musculus]
CARGRVAMDYW